MLLAIAVLLVQTGTAQPQSASQLSFSAEKIAFVQPETSAAKKNFLSKSLSFADDSAVEDSAIPEPTLESMREPAANMSAETGSTVEPTTETNPDVLPDAPVPVAEADPLVPLAFIKSGKSLTVSVDELRAENRRKQLIWKGLAIATSGAATFDAWTTRRAIGQFGAVELNPMLKPFAGNASLYAAIQIGPVLLDYAGKKMMYNHHAFVRRLWWVPQSASFVSSVFCGAHNLSYR